MKIAMFDVKPYDVPGFTKYGAENGIEFKFYDTRLGEDTAALARGCDGVCLFVNDTLNAAVIDQLTEYGVRVAALRCAGYNNVDLEHAFGRLHVFHVPAYSPHAVAEHAMALLLTSVRRIHKAFIRTRDFNFSLNGLAGFDLHGKTAGVVGTGRIGRVFIDICRGFGMNVIAYDKFPAKDAGIEYVTFDELLEKSDVISFHCPLNAESYHMFGADAIEKCKKGVVVINTSRGALIDSEALLAGIKSRRIGAACLDVYEEESDIFFNDFSGHIMDDDTLARLISMPNVIVTSHQAFLTEEALSNIARTTVDNIFSILDEGACANELCYQCGKVGDCIKNRSGKCF
jgi:D-lactate dehydrogenase